VFTTSISDTQSIKVIRANRSFTARIYWHWQDYWRAYFWTFVYEVKTWGNNNSFPIIGFLTFLNSCTVIDSRATRRAANKEVFQAHSFLTDKRPDLIHTMECNVIKSLTNTENIQGIWLKYIISCLGKTYLIAKPLYRQRAPCTFLPAKSFWQTDDSW